jgi:hypothetical protein
LWLLCKLVAASSQKTAPRPGLEAAKVTEPSSGYTEYLLAEIRAAILRAKLWQNDLVAIGIALKGGFIDPDNALEHLHDCGALRLVAPSSSIFSSS